MEGGRGGGKLTAKTDTSQIACKVSRLKWHSCIEHVPQVLDAVIVKKWSKIILLCGWLEAIKTRKLRSYAKEPMSILVESFELYSLNQHVITSIRREKIGK